MTKYLLRRILHALVSVIIVVAIIMTMIYSMLDRNLIFATDPQYTKVQNNQQTTYKYRMWQEYGYLDYLPYTLYLQNLETAGEIDPETRTKAASFARTPDKDSEIVKEYAAKYEEYCAANGYTVIRLDAIMATANKYVTGGQQQYFAYKNRPLYTRLVKYFTGLLTVDNIHNVKEDVGERGLSFTLRDPVYGGEKFAPAILANGTTHKYLLYTDNKFPYIHQNLVTISLGKSYSVNKGVDVFTTMTRAQGSYLPSVITYPTGLVEESADDLHTAVYVKDSRETSLVYTERFSDDYTSVQTVKAGLSRIGYSFVMGIISAAFAYLLGVPIGIWMARKKDKLVDKIGTIYIVFIIAVPSLAYIFLFKAIGAGLGLPTTFDMESTSKLIYILPIVSLTLPSVAGLMRWLRRYMIDEMNSDYVKFARSGGLTENEIFSRHILKNAAIPLIHGIPGTVLGALVGALVTERVYTVPGAGNLLTTAINNYDNGVIVGVTLFYALLSVISLILGDILMAMVDPRISYSSKAR